ncbi:hypothetical protein VB636_20875 [Paracoccus sp. APAP_BH8]|uniref:hypothetical protein n=1 Tax=Paracoccus sp. APAP_BH8 TaxID=3110237 RepID=UPI002FD7B031
MATKKQGEATAQTVAADVPADPAPAAELTEASGAVIEPEVLATVDLGHESADSNPRDGTTAAQNQIDWNDPKRASPRDDDFAGQGLDLSVYGKGAKS